MRWTILVAGLLLPISATADTVPPSFQHCLKADDPATGVEACEDTLKSTALLESERAQALLSLAGYQRRTGALAEALGNLDKAAVIAPQAGSIPAERAIVLHLSGDLAGAMAAHDRALELEKGTVYRLNNRGVTRLALGETSLAIADFDAAVSLYGENGTVLDNRATAHCRAGNVDASVTDRLTAISLGAVDEADLGAAISAAGIDSGGSVAEAIEAWTRAGCHGAPKPKLI